MGNRRWFESNSPQIPVCISLCRPKKRASLASLDWYSQHSFWHLRLSFVFYFSVTQRASLRSREGSILFYSPGLQSILRESLRILQSVRGRTIFIADPRGGGYLKSQALNFIQGRLCVFASTMLYRGVVKLIPEGFFIFFLCFGYGFLNFLGLASLISRSGGLALPAYNSTLFRAPLPLVHSMEFSEALYPGLLLRLLS